MIVIVIVMMITKRLGYQHWMKTMIAKTTTTLMTMTPIVICGVIFVVVVVAQSIELCGDFSAHIEFEVIVIVMMIKQRLGC